MENISPEDKTKIVNLIKANLTPLDKFINFDYEYYDIKKYKGLIVPTNKSVKDTNRKFTEPFLKYINEIVKDLSIDKWTDTIAYIISGLFVPLNIPSTYRTERFDTIDKPYPFAYYYSPVNRLYFLFLVNLYCNYQNYVKDYEWLDSHFLFLCDQIGLTGIFAINKNLYNELCGDCAETSRGVGIVDDGYFLISNSSVRTKYEKMPPVEQKTQRERMSKFIADSKKERKVFKFGKTRNPPAGKSQNPPAGKSQNPPAGKSRHTLSNAVVAAAASAETKPSCTHGSRCYRQGNAVHMDQYSHPLPQTLEEDEEEKNSNAGGAKPKRKTYKKKQIYKKKKTNKKKTHKKKTNKRK